MALQFRVVKEEAVVVAAVDFEVAEVQIINSLSFSVFLFMFANIFLMKDSAAVQVTARTVLVVLAAIQEQVEVKVLIVF